MSSNASVSNAEKFTSDLLAPVTRYFDYRHLILQPDLLPPLHIPDYILYVRTRNEL